MIEKVINPCNIKILFGEIVFVFDSKMLFMSFIFPCCLGQYKNNSEV